MELKEMIAELREFVDDKYEGRMDRKAASAAAEALALVAWAEERLCDICNAGLWYCEIPDGKGGVELSATGRTMLGAIRAAKEAYEDAK